MGLLYSNYENKQETNFKVNQVSGILAKTLKESYFVKFQDGSNMQRNYFDDEYSYRYDEESGKKVKIVVLQVMLCNNDCFLVEAIDNADYEKYFENNKREYKDN